MKIQAKKSLGQHFLTNPGVIDRIADTVATLAQTQKVDFVVEIGPGRGALTRALIERKLEVKALERDESLEIILRNELRSHNNFELFMGDVLDKHNSLELYLKSLPEKTTYLVCGNLPYNIGTEIVFHFFEQRPQAVAFVYMLQKEVVKKFLSSGDDADFGTASLKMSLAARIMGHFWVTPGSFAPPPKVDSGVFWFNRKSPPEFETWATLRGGNYDKVAQLAHRLFLHRRKMLRAIDSVFKNSPWETLRPQQISPSEFVKIAIEWLPNQKK
jgi:16S rRNA (adenine1518-N6/adenine1519-N6)-dimethyltransferase